MTVEDVGLTSLAKSPDDQSSPRSVKTETSLQLEVDLDWDGNGSIYSADNDNERQQRARLLAPSALRYHSASPAPSSPQSWKVRCRTLWTANKGLVLVLISQFFGGLMNVATRLLETSDEPLNTFQASQDMWGLYYAGWRLIEWHRSFFGIYYSLMYLPLADATVITFLAPIVTCWACSVLIKEPFTRPQQIAGLVSLIGVVLIARPTSFFTSDAGDSAITSGASGADAMLPTSNTTLPAQLEGVGKVTSAQRLVAVGVALVGVFGAATAYTTIRWIGQRAHPLISVNYFAAWTTFVAAVVLLFVPGMHFKLPSGLKQWTYLVFLGVCGFVMQILITAGLAYEKSSRATNMVYTQMLFALAFDKLVFDTTPGVLSILGSSLILGSALYIAVLEDPSRKVQPNQRVHGDEEDGLEASSDAVDTPTNEERGALRGIQQVQLRTLRV
ncbi:MAG: hypothetical protein Q9219_002000 [cf. Caloplaca sp. 3 TL-2023]